MGDDGRKATEVAMGLERNETAGRFMEALLHAGEPQEIAKTVEIAVGCADALLARLCSATVAPVADAAPRPEWVRWKASELFPDVPRRVLRWVDDCPVVGRMSTRNSNDGPDEALESEPIPVGDWEPCAAPAPSPAATPAAWVPSVGDVVQDKDHPEFAQLLVTRVDAPAFYAKVITCTGAPTDEVMRYADRYRFVRRATSSERAAAGLPVDESAFDEAKEREAARKAWLKFPRPFDGSRDGYVEGWVDALRARVAAKGGAK